MTHLLSMAAFLLHRVTESDLARPGLSGIYIDPSKGVAMASDGKRLVEISAPKVEGFQAKGYELANGESRPFIVPKQAAQEILKHLPKECGVKAHRYAALARSKESGKVTILAGTPGKLMPVTFAPIDAAFPNTEKIWPAKEPKASIVVNPDLLASSLKAATSDEGKCGLVMLTLHVFDECVVLQSQSEDGSRIRAIQMGVNGKPIAYRSTEVAVKSAPVSKVVKESSVAKDSNAHAPAPSKGQAVVKPASVPSIPPPQARFHRPASRGAWRPKPKPGDGENSTGPSIAQLAFYCYLVRAHGEDLAAKHFEATDLSAKIDLLKADKSQNATIATWLQWRKLFLLLDDQKVAHEKRCEVLNGLRDVSNTSDVIREWLGENNEAEAA